MNKKIGITIITIIMLSLTMGCSNKNTTKKVANNSTSEETITLPQNNNTFRGINPNEVGRVEVICHNCQAHFKLSPQIQKMSLKGDAIIECPVCHHNYLKKEGS